MPETSLKRRVMHSPQDLLDFVIDVERYPEFINLLSAIRISNRKHASETVETFDAEATVRFKFLSETFKSNVMADRGENRIRVTKAGKGGAVKSLENRWQFRELSDGSTLVDFYVDVSLNAFPLNMLLKDKFGKAADHIMNLFEVKAGQVLEKVGDPDLDWEAEIV